MIGLKKFIAGIVAIVSMASCFTTIPLGVNADTTYKKGDVNGDGLVNNTDTQWARMFLYGMAGVSDNATAERLDVNQDGIIDENDINIIRNIILKIETGTTLSFYNPLGVPAQENNRLYYVYDSNGDYLRKYSLDKVSNINKSSISTYSIIDDDERYLDNSVNGVVRFHYKNSQNGFTGFVVDSHTILTAAHCVSQRYDAAVPSSSYTIEFYDENGVVNKNITATPVEYHVPYQFMYNYVNTDFDLNMYDYALITVKEDLSDYICFNLGVARNNIRSKDPDVYVTGYSNTHLAPHPEFMGLRTTAFGKLISVNSYNFSYNTDTTGGDSGAPIYIINNNIKTVIGIHTNGEDYDNEFNHGTRITTDILHFVYNNYNFNY